MPELLIAQCRHDEQDCVGAGQCCLVNLHIVERKVLSQQRARDSRANQGQIIEMPEKEFLVRQHRDTVSACLIVKGGRPDGIEVRGDDSRRRRSAFNLSDETKFLGFQLLSEAAKASLLRSPFSPVLRMGEPGFYFLALVRHNFSEPAHKPRVTYIMRPKISHAKNFLIRGLSRA